MKLALPRAFCTGPHGQSLIGRFLLKCTTRPYTAEKKRLVRVAYRQRDLPDTLVSGEEGQDLMRLAHENNIDLEGACEGSLACSTCHVILDKASYDCLPPPGDEENDMLDLAFGLTET